MKWLLSLSLPLSFSGYSLILTGKYVKVVINPL
jgi:hypothetical protein